MARPTTDSRLDLVRWTLSTVALILAPVCGVLGWAAAFTSVGALLIYLAIGLAMFGFAVRPRRSTALWAGFGLFVAIGWALLVIAISGVAGRLAG